MPLQLFLSLGHKICNGRTDGQAQSNMPLQLFQSWGIKIPIFFGRLGISFSHLTYTSYMVTFSFNLMAKVCVIAHLLYPLFSSEKKAILISYQSRSVVRLSVHASVTFLVNVSPPKLLDLATSNFIPR